MMTENFRTQPHRLVQWQLGNTTFYLGTGLVAWLLIGPMGMEFLQLPVIPLTIMGSAIGIFASFRSNQAYDRWWEGRKLWGRLINSSRHWSTQVVHYVGTDNSALAEQIVLRHCGYVHALRCLLRKQDPWTDADFLRHIEPDEALKGSTNLTHALLDRQMADLVALANDEKLDERRLESFDDTLIDLLNIQGGCERIKGTPLPRGYAMIVELMIQIFAIMLPFSLVHEMGIIAVPMNALVCLAFALISEAGRVLEDPFSNFYNGLPLKALSIKIEQNIRERLGHTDLPPTVKESSIGVLM
ncbi:MAG: putative membrane protein [Myxococcota bacterium]|jgi:putative membrane protein